VARTSNNRVISSGDLYCCLLPRCEALRTFPIATVATLPKLSSQLCETESGLGIVLPANSDHEENSVRHIFCLQEAFPGAVLHAYDMQFNCCTYDICGVGCIVEACEGWLQAHLRMFQLVLF